MYSFAISFSFLYDGRCCAIANDDTVSDYEDAVLRGFRELGIVEIGAAGVTNGASVRCVRQVTETIEACSASARL